MVTWSENSGLLEINILSWVTSSVTLRHTIITVVPCHTMSRDILRHIHDKVTMILCLRQTMQGLQGIKSEIHRVSKSGKVTLAKYCLWWVG